MKKLLKYLSIFLVALAAVSCGKEKADMSDLLASVPSSVGGLMGINVTSILNEAGFNVENGEIKPGKDTQYTFKSIPSSQRETLEIFFSGESGIDPSGALLFYDNSRTYLTFALNDIEKFKKFAEKKNQSSFSEEKGISICGNIAMKGAQAWMAVTAPDINADIIAGYASLTPSQSFLEQSFAKKLQAMDHDMMGWGKINVLSRSLLNFQQGTMFTLLSSILFEDAQDIEFVADFEKGEFESEISVLDSKGKPAKYLLPKDKINETTAKSIGVNCDVFLAANFSKKYFEKFDKIGSLAGPQYDNFKDMLEGVDGTFAIALSNPDDLIGNMNGVVTTNGNQSMKLKALISELLGPYRVDGDLIRFSKGRPGGELKIKECAEMLDDCTVGLVTDFPAYPISELASFPLLAKCFDSFKLYCLKLEPDGGSVKLEIIIKSKNEKENILKTILDSTK